MIVNKYDYEDDELDEIINHAKEIIKDVKFYRISSHYMFMHHSRILNTEETFPKEFNKEYAKIMRTCGMRHQLDQISHSGDFDNLMTRLTNLDIVKQQIECIKTAILNCISTKNISQVSNKIILLGELTHNSMWSDDYCDSILSRRSVLGCTNISKCLELDNILIKYGMSADLLDYLDTTNLTEEHCCIVRLCEILIRHKYNYSIYSGILINYLATPLAWKEKEMSLHIDIDYLSQLLLNTDAPVDIIKTLDWSDDDELKNLPQLIDFGQQQMAKIFLTNQRNSNYYKEIFTLIPENHNMVMDYIYCCVNKYNATIKTFITKIFGLTKEKNTLFIRGIESLAHRVFDPPDVSECFYYYTQ